MKRWFKEIFADNNIIGFSRSIWRTVNTIIIDMDEIILFLFIFYS